jgi:hypothetical protein
LKDVFASNTNDFRVPDREALAAGSYTCVGFVFLPITSSILSGSAGTPNLKCGTLGSPLRVFNLTCRNTTPPICPLGAGTQLVQNISG